MVTINRRLTILSGFVFLLMSILAYFVYAGIQNDGGMNAVTLLSPGQVVNGVANGSHHANNVTNVSRYINVSAFVGSDLFTYDAINSTNFTFWFNGAGGAGGIGGNANVLALSVIVYNTTVNQTFFTNATVDSRVLLLDGYYNLTINATNVSNFVYGNATTKGVYTNLLIDNSAPFIRSAVMNTSNTSNFSGGSVGINFEVDTNDTWLFVDQVLLGFTHTRNVTEFNVSMTRNAGIWIYNLTFTGMGEGVYIVKLYPNDSLNNLLSNVSNLTFTIDRTSPNVSVFVTNTSSSNMSNFSSSAGVIQFNITANDSLTAVANITIGITSTRNGTQFNMTTVGRAAGQWQAELLLGTLVESVYTVRIYANDSVGNINMSVGNFTFSIDTNSPNVTGFVINSSNNSLLRRGVLQLNVSINDTITTVQNVLFGFTNDKNATGFNVSASSVIGSWQLSLPLSDLDDGNYSISVFTNDSVGNANSTVNNLSFMLDQNAPNVTAFLFNTTNNSVLSRGALQFNVTVNDSMTRVVSVLFGLKNDKNTTGFNITASAVVGGFYQATLPLSDLDDGNYTVSVWSDDGISNINDTLSNFSFMVDQNAPNVTAFLFNTSNNSALRRGALQFNVTVNDSMTRVVSVLFGLKNDKNTTGFNITASAVAGGFYQATLPLSDLDDGNYTVSVWSDDGISNANNTLSNFSFMVDQNAPNVTFHTNLTTFDTNLSSGGIQFNITANDSMTRVTTIVLGYTNDKNGSQGNLSITEPSGGTFNISFSIAVLMDGIYTMTVYANDTLNNFNGSNANFTFRVDKSAPNITAITMTNYTTSSLNLTSTAAANFISLNATVNDTTTTVIGVIFGINSTNASEFNVTPSLTAGRWNATINLTYLTEGEHVVHVYANDSLGNYNSTETFRVVIDRTAPSISVSCTPSTPTAGETVTCTCTASDGGTGVVSGSNSFSGTGSATESTTASGSGTVSSSTCSAVDFAGNRGTGSGSWTVTAASSGGSGGGGSGGGASSGATGQFEKKTWTSINAGETATLPVDNGAIGVTEVSFGVADTTYGAWVQVRKLESLPSSVATSLPAAKVYRNLEFTQQNVEEKLSGLVTIEFKVEKAWLTTNKVGKANVAMYHYDDSAWKELATTLGEDDGTYVHYSAQTPGFSYFAIGQKAAAAEVTQEEGAAAVEEEAAFGDEVGPVEEIVPAQEEGAMEDVTGGFNAIWLVPIVVLIVVIGLLVWYWKK